MPADCSASGAPKLRRGREGIGDGVHHWRQDEAKSQGSPGASLRQAAGVERRRGGEAREGQDACLTPPCREERPTDAQGQAPLGKDGLREPDVRLVEALGEVQRRQSRPAAKPCHEGVVVKKHGLRVATPLGTGLVRVHELGGAGRDIPVSHQGPRSVHNRGNGERSSGELRRA
eukprot:15438297-Alexandrium_andersonii.AAC.1